MPSVLARLPETHLRVAPDRGLGRALGFRPENAQDQSTVRSGGGFLLPSREEVDAEGGRMRRRAETANFAQAAGALFHRRGRGGFAEDAEMPCPSAISA